MPKSLRHGR
jgi:hypothetical protein